MKVIDVEGAEKEIREMAKSMMKATMEAIEKGVSLKNIAVGLKGIVNLIEVTPEVELLSLQDILGGKIGEKIQKKVQEAKDKLHGKKIDELKDKFKEHFSGEQE